MATRAKANPQLLNVNRVPGQPKRRKKITLVFDENKRREFLGGFHKRKVQRQKRAQEELLKQLKEERRKIKQDAKERYKKLLSNRDVPELEKLLSAQEYDTEGHTVSILELDVAALSEGCTLIGENRGVAQSEDEEEMQEDNENTSDKDGEIVGMSLTGKKKISTPQRAVVNNEKIKSKKDLKRVLKAAALKQIKKSKVFQQKQRLERQKNKKQSRKDLRKRRSQRNESRSKKKSMR